MKTSEVKFLIEEARKYKITSLDLSCNKLTSLPAEISKLKDLRELDMSGNRLTSIPSEILELTKPKKTFFIW